MVIRQKAQGKIELAIAKFQKAIRRSLAIAIASYQKAIEIAILILTLSVIVASLFFWSKEVPR